MTKAILNLNGIILKAVLIETENHGSTFKITEGNLKNKIVFISTISKSDSFELISIHDLVKEESKITVVLNYEIKTQKSFSYVCPKSLTISYCEKLEERIDNRIDKLKEDLQTMSLLLNGVEYYSIEEMKERI